jgi:molybdenum cofactor cytidylyltransferase
MMEIPETRAERRIAAVVLAAGASTRLGQAKQLVRVAGESLLRRTARMALEAGCAAVVVVLGFEAERMRPELDGLPVKITENPRWAEGMASSLRCGVESVQRMEPDGVLLLVCDQPRLSAEHLRILLSRHRGKQTITASAYAGNMGVPVVFGRELFPELLALQGDQGARAVILRHGEQTEGIPWPEGTVDLDRPEDLRRVE